MPVTERYWAAALPVGGSGIVDALRGTHVDGLLLHRSLQWRKAASRLWSSFAPTWERGHQA
jgi:hypothetical protein